MSEIFLAAPCPQCGAWDSYRTVWDGRRCGWYMQCIMCGYRTETERTADQAREKWGKDEHRRF